MSALSVKDLATLPSRRDENWRWSDLRGLFKTELAQTPAQSEPVPAGGPFAALGVTEVVVANGRLNWWTDEEQNWPPAPVDILAHEAPEKPDDSLIMGAMAAAKSSDPPVTIIRFREGEEPLAWLRIVSRAQGTGHHARIGILVEQDVKATLLESYEGSGWDYLANTFLEIILMDGASLERIVITDEAPRAVSVSTAGVDMRPGCNYAQTILTTGAKRLRQETHVRHRGEQSAVRLDGVYLCADQRHADITTVVDHRRPGGSTSELVKGAVSGQGRAVFQGRIVVAEGADQTDARMGHHALILSDRGEVDAKPELLIYADDVSCAHGNTVGALDENALFYARQRGIPEAEAKAMLTQAFVGEVVDRIEHEGARDICRAWVGDKLRGLG